MEMPLLLELLQLLLSMCPSLKIIFNLLSLAFLARNLGSKKTKEAKKSERSQPKKSSVSGKKNKKRSSKKSRKVPTSPSLSSSNESSVSESEEDTQALVPVDQVLFIYLVFGFLFSLTTYT